MSLAVSIYQDAISEILMKVQKIVSLDVETAQIAQEMRNFSYFVRNSLRAHANDMAIGDEIELRLKWVGACKHIAAAFADYLQASGVENAPGADQLIAMALEQRRITEWIE